MISIIVPVFNTEKYIKTCIDSILQQSLKEIELILVDDGSSDSSGEICDEYAKEDFRVQVIHQKNNGRVSARRAGLLQASCNYVMFFDSDDWIERTMCEELLQIALDYKADLVTSGYIREDGKTYLSEFDAFSEGIYRIDQDLNELLNNSFVYYGTDCYGIIPSIWTKLYRKSIAIQAMQCVPENLYRGEDLLFNNLYLMRCKTVFVSKKAYYHYRIHRESTVNSSTPDFVFQIGMMQNVIKEEALSLGYKEEYLRGVNTRTFLNFVRLWNENQEEIRIPYYCFQTEMIKAEKIVLYGAGKVGQDYYRQLQKLMPGKMVLWVDRVYQKYRHKYEVYPVDSIASADFGQILIGVESEYMADEIKYFLVEHFQIQEEKIVWQKPDFFWF